MVLFAVSVAELIDPRLVVGRRWEHMPEWWRRPGVPIAALAVGALLGHFFWQEATAPPVRP